MAIDTPTILGDIWMELKDRTLLAALMEQRGLSARKLATLAGWRSHTYLQRLLRGEAKTLSVEPAARIAHELKVPFSLLFMTRVSTNADRNGQKVSA